MADITDFENGSPFIKIPKYAFADKTYFENLVNFLKLPKDTDGIEIKVNQKYVNKDIKIISQNYRSY